MAIHIDRLGYTPYFQVAYASIAANNSSHFLPKTYGPSNESHVSDFLGNDVQVPMIIRSLGFHYRTSLGETNVINGPPQGQSGGTAFSDRTVTGIEIQRQNGIKVPLVSKDFYGVLDNDKYVLDQGSDSAPSRVFIWKPYLPVIIQPNEVLSVRLALTAAFFSYEFADASSSTFSYSIDCFGLDSGQVYRFGKAVASSTGTRSAHKNAFGEPIQINAFTVDSRTASRWPLFKMGISQGNAWTLYERHMVMYADNYVGGKLTFDFLPGPMILQPGERFIIKVRNETGIDEADMFVSLEGYYRRGSEFQR